MAGLRGCESTNTRAAVVLGKESEGIGLVFCQTNGSVTVPCRVMADMNLVAKVTAGIVFRYTKVVLRIIKGAWMPGSAFSKGTGDSRCCGKVAVGGSLLCAGGNGWFQEFHGDGCLGLIEKLISNCFQTAGSSLFVFGAGFGHTRKLEGVLNGLAFLAGVATLGDLGIVGRLQKGIFQVAAVAHPDVDNGKFGVSNTLSNEIDRNNVLDILFFETFALPKGSGLILSVDTRDGTSKSILNRETDVGRILKVDLDWYFGVHGHSINVNEFSFRVWTFAYGRSLCGWEKSINAKRGAGGRRCRGRSGGRRSRRFAW
mmetsp:Transcript_2434/g.5822  ORF Transcript_2434/g.5822 Transcript_2434/m.5822 type:complete len:314 (+) Transcript_2434:195-1136(+)